MGSEKKLLGELSFVSRTFEGGFKESPFVLDMDANLYIGPADHLCRDEHAAVEAVYHFLAQQGRVQGAFKDLLRNRCLLLDAFREFDAARFQSHSSEFRICIFGTYDGSMLVPLEDDELPAGPCGKTVGEIKRRFYDLCRRLDREFDQRELSAEQHRAEAAFVE
jgi:hypothetical protein